MSVRERFGSSSFRVERGGTAVSTRPTFRDDGAVSHTDGVTAEPGSVSAAHLGSVLLGWVTTTHEIAGQNSKIAAIQVDARTKHR